MQTNVQDPDNHLQNFRLHQSISITGIPKPKEVSSKSDPLPPEREMENQDEEISDEESVTFVTDQVSQRQDQASACCPFLLPLYVMLIK